MAILGVVVAALEDRLVVGDDSAVRDLFEAYGPMILGIGRRLVGDEAEDLVRQVVVAAWRHRERFDPSKGSLAAWLAVIARLAAADRLGVVGVDDSGDPGVPAGGSEAEIEAKIDRVVDRLVLARLLGVLPPVRRDVLELGFFDDLDDDEIAERLDLPHGTVRSHMRRGLAALQRELEDSRVPI